MRNLSSALAARIVSVIFLSLLSACSSFESNPVMHTLQYVVPRGADVERTRFDPPFHYLRVVVDGNVVFMASDTPDIDAAGTTAVWYSAEREVLRFRDGRLVAAVGLGTEWRGVVLPDLPAWSELALVKEPLRWTRTRDVMPGYRYGVHDTLVLRRIPPPSDSRLKGIESHTLTWFEERIDPGSEGKTGRDSLPPARYALDVRDGVAAVVYGEHCLSAELCFSWQRWPVRTGQVR